MFPCGRDLPRHRRTHRSHSGSQGAETAAHSSIAIKLFETLKKHGSRTRFPHVGIEHYMI